MGCCLALELAQRGYRVDLVDLGSAPMTGASLHNEGKLHLGYVYANDPLKITHGLMLRGSLAFSHIIEKLTGCAAEALSSSQPFQYYVPIDSQLSMTAIGDHFHEVEQAIHEQIKNFLKGTIAENAPIIPISAQHNINIDVLIQTIQEQFKTPKRNSNADPLFYIARSFDVNKPGTLIKNISGGVLGGAMSAGILKVGETIEIRPGLKKEKHGKTIWEPIITEISGMITGENSVKEITPGGSAAIQTKLDPALVKTDSLVGNIIGLPGTMPEVLEKLEFKPELLKRVVGAKDDLVVEPVKKGETLMLNVNATATVGFITDLKKDLISLDLKKPVCASKGDRITLSRMIGARWRLIGYGNLD